MIKLILSSLMLVVFLTSSSYSQATASNISRKKPILLFKSGFEKGVYLDVPYNDGGGCWFQDVKGSDNQKFSWPITLWGSHGTFQVLVDSKRNSKEYIQNKIVTVKGHDGKPRKANRIGMFMGIM